MFTDDVTIDGFDDELATAMRAESVRQEQHIELIASENIVSATVMEHQGCVMTNQYAEGYLPRRDYGGCGPVDIA